MLQQTRVEAVKGYYARFLTELPTIAALADCPPDRLTKLWEGLGYYSRVRNLQKAAKIIMEESGGVFPKTYDAVRALPGIGDYTAGAICSICFELPTPAVDGNVLRVLSRVMEDGAPVTNQKTKTAYREALVPLYEDGPARHAHAGAHGAGRDGVRAERRAAVRRLPAEGGVPCKCARHVGRLSREGREKAEARGGKDGFLSDLRRLPCRPKAREPGTSGRAVGASECGGKAGRGAGAMLCGRGRMRAGGVSEKRRAGACVHAYHLAHALLLYGMQAKIAGICLGGCAKTARGCGAADGVPDVRERNKKLPAQSVLRGELLYLCNQPMFGSAAKLF